MASTNSPTILLKGYVYRIIYMEMSNLRVGELRDYWLRCYTPNQKDPGSNPTSRT